MKTILSVRGTMIAGAMLMSLTLGGCASDYGYRHHDRHGEPHRCHDGERGNNRGCGRFDANGPDWRD